MKLLKVREFARFALFQLTMQLHAMNFSKEKKTNIKTNERK